MQLPKTVCICLYTYMYIYLYISIHIDIVRFKEVILERENRFKFNSELGIASKQVSALLCATDSVTTSNINEVTTFIPICLPVSGMSPVRIPLRLVFYIS